MKESPIANGIEWRMMPKETLQDLKEFFWDDFNFVSGDEESLDTVECIDEEQRRRRSK